MLKHARPWSPAPPESALLSKIRAFTPLLGAHMSIEGGLYRAVERAESIGCNTLQIFTRNSGQWRARPISPEDSRQFHDVRRRSAINPVFAHTSYLINLGACGELHEKSVDALILELERAEELGLEFVVMHPGAHCGLGEAQGLRNIVAGLDRALRATSGMKCRIALENTAGQGSCLGCSFDHLEFFLHEVQQPERIGFCIDTCHLFASGYDIRTRASYKATFDLLLEKVTSAKILAFHLNDCKKHLGCKVDRHEHIGKGQIGEKGFRYLMRDSRFAAIPKVLETPKGKDLAEDVKNLSLLRSLL